MAISVLPSRPSRRHLLFALATGMPVSAEAIAGQDPISHPVAYPTPPQWGPLLERWPAFRWLGPAVPINLTVGRHSELCDVHNEVRGRCPYKLDLRTHGKLDYWEPATEAGGDCEDQALARWQVLLGLGWPTECLSLCLCQGAAGHHAVLLVLCESGSVVLDNWAWMPAALPDMTASICAPGGYRWLARSNGDEWISMTLGGGFDETQVMHPDIRAFNRLA